MPRKARLNLVVPLGVGVVMVGASALALAGGGGAPAGAEIRNVAGQTVGSLQVEDAGTGKSKITVNVTNLPAGYHGFHVHAKGVCDPTSIDPVSGTPFFSAGGHFDVGGHSHDHHTGDLPNLLVGADGTGTASSVTDRFRVAQLFDADGSSIMIHALADNFANIPDRYRNAAGEKGPDAETKKAGDSGARIACGVITKN
ncbi:superoxide dismutase family protein [Herbidospora mongoliensis]|uniref:superoxide dismutase family protein n=1 Tax=Herbidospora mongoliensis TaxID=688067 RepID=UPI00082B58B2|nr:superoxide dismutase family protein [Herbidospora mongoliensis]